MEDLRKDSVPIPEVRTSEPATDAESENDSAFLASNGTESTTPSKNVPHTMHITGSTKIHIGPLYNCIDPASVRTPPPGSTSPLHCFGGPEQKKGPPKAHVEALLACNKEIDDSVKDLVSEHIGYDWRQLGRQMKYSEGQLDNIDADCPRPKNKAYKLITYWHDRESSKATLANLTRLLMKSKAFEVVIRLKPC